jgi:hypothetical protein
MNTKPGSGGRRPGSGRKPKNFFWQDKSGRGFTNNFNMSEVKRAFIGERNYDGKAVSTWADGADVGDEWKNNANLIIRTE